MLAQVTFFFWTLQLHDVIMTTASPVASSFSKTQHNISNLGYAVITAIKNPRRGVDIESLLEEFQQISALHTLLTRDFKIRPFLWDKMLTWQHTGLLVFASSSSLNNAPSRNNRTPRLSFSTLISRSHDDSATSSGTTSMKHFIHSVLFT